MPERKFGQIKITHHGGSAFRLPLYGGLCPPAPSARLAALVCLCLLALSACGLPFGAKQHVSGPPEQIYQQTYRRPAANYGMAQTGARVLELARSQIGVPYRWGGEYPKDGFDCSGLLFWVYRQNGVRMPRLAKAQAGYGRPVHISMLLPGDIVIFRIRGAYHTGIYSGGGNFIHSPRRGQRVREESMGISYWRRSFMGARRVM